MTMTWSTTNSLRLGPVVNPAESSERRDFNSGRAIRTSGKTYSGTAAVASGRVGKVDHEPYTFS